MGAGIICQCLKTAIATGGGKLAGDVQLSACLLSFEGVFYNLAVALAAYKYRVGRRYKADALFITVGLVAHRHKALILYVFDIARLGIGKNGHHVETSRWRLVICYSIAITSQPRNAAIVACGYGLGEFVLLVYPYFLSRNLYGCQHQEGRDK